MSTVIDANMKLFADRMHITSSRMIRDYGLKTVEEIIEAEAERGNTHAVEYAREYSHSPEKLIKVFKLANVENKFVLLHKMDDHSREKVLPLLKEEDLVQGLYFFRQEKLLDILLNVHIKELVNVILEAFPIEAIVQMFTEDDMAMFFMNKDLPKPMVIEQMRCMPPEAMQKFVEGVTGMPMGETDPNELIMNISNLPDDEYRKFMACIDPDVQKQLMYQLSTEDPRVLMLLPNITYVNMLSTMMKPDMVKSMIKLNKETLVKIDSKLPDDLMAIVAAQIDTKVFAKFLQDGHMDVLQKAMMI